MPYTDQDIDVSEQRGTIFDFRGFLFKALNLWRLLLLSISFALLIAYLINVRKENVYKLNSLISVESEQNPFFTANTSISFNWGGVSGKVGKIMTAINTRSHNEKVVDSLQFFMNYLVEGKYRKVDVYKNAPFVFILDKTGGQLLNQPIGIRFVNETQFEVFTQFSSKTGQVQRYKDKAKYDVNVPVGEFNKVYNLEESIQLPFFNGTIIKRNKGAILSQSEFFIQFLNFDNIVYKYQRAVQISTYAKSSSVLKLALAGNNKSKIVDYLNATSSILSKTELERKNLYATNTIKFIDSSLAAVNMSLKDVTEEMNDFRKKNKVFDIDDEISQTSIKLKEFDIRKEGELSKLNYLNSLEAYLQTKTDYTKIAAPTSVGINEGNILTSVSKITELAIERQSLEYTTREGSSLFKDLDRRIDAEKNVLLETISATKNTIGIQLNTINRNIAKFEAELSDLPEDQQQYLKIQRKLNISQESYDLYMAKRSEAAIVKAANVSDITVIDEAKDIGNPPIGPNKTLNYMMGLMVGFFGPMSLIFVIFLLDNTIHGADEIERLSSIPILGLIGKYAYKNNLIVFDKPKSAVAESFRAIRSSLQFIYKKQGDSDLGKTIMITSSVSGEGKTFCSINIATAYALTGKKTIVIGLDLRKPKIFNDFNITNESGVVNYLIGESTLNEIKHATHIENLDVIPSGPVPPNPSELLMSVHMKTMIEQLRKEYDMIVLDTPPLGLVADALELTQYSDATIFMVRLDYTKKGMLSLINAKHRVGEVKNISYVLNFYKHKSSHSYGYGYGYGYGTYGNAYHENNENNSLWSRFKRFVKRT